MGQNDDLNVGNRKLQSKMLGQLLRPSVKIIENCLINIS